MNSEELEVSLKTEFENYLNGLAGEMRRNISDFQAKIEAEFEKHRTQLDEAFRELNGRFENDPQIDQPFREMISDHLRLARDDGARVAATAFGEAEKLAAEMAAPLSPRFDLIRNAVNDISSERTQAAILQALINRSADFAPRGAFFIARGEDLMGWNAFAGGQNNLEDTAREISVPITTDTLISKAISGMRTASQREDAGSEDALFLRPLGFSDPDGGVAIPLVVRGRAVAVLYADSASGGEAVNTEALETLVQVAALTVDLRGSVHSARPMHETAAPPIEQPSDKGAIPAPADEVYPSGDEYSPAPPDVVSPEASAAEFEAAEYHGAVAVEVEAEAAEQADYAAISDDSKSAEAAVEISYFEPVAEPEIEAVEYEAEETQTVSEFVLESADAEYSLAADEPIPAPAEELQAEPVETFEQKEGMSTAAIESSNGTEGKPAAVEASEPRRMRRRFSERKVDLPIEVAEEERPLHSKALLFARLLVSEIKLYNKERVQEGRDAGDLYDRLREAIDRSREMYDKRTEPAVSSKFDYFHYELVNGLAEGQEAKLGAGYPGPA